MAKTRSQTKSKAALPGGPPSRWRLALELVVCLGLSLLAQNLLFAPIAIWPLAFVALVPWFYVVVTFRHAPTVHIASYLLGLAFFLINVRWLALVTVEGYVALSAYLAVYYPLVACLVRHLARRRQVPLAFGAPVVWVASELCRATVISGFPWFFMGHSPYRVLPLIQISDLAGAYAVSFVIVAVNGALADLLLTWVQRRRGTIGFSLKRSAVGSIWAGGLVVATLVYGFVQLGRSTTAPGPRIAVLQGDYPSFTEPERIQTVPGPFERMEHYRRLFAAAAVTEPDMFVLPETPWMMSLNREFRQQDPTDSHLDRGQRWLIRLSRESYEMFYEQARRHQAYVVTGALTRIPTPYSLQAKEIRKNSACIFPPSGEPMLSYDKVHCVYFGEVVPFRYGHLRFFYLWVNRRLPFGQDDFEYSLTPGTEFKVFSVRPRSQPQAEYQIGVPICYEGVMPYVSRRFVTDSATGAKRVDFLLNISNDGWFLHSNELSQHLCAYVFRAIENRVPIARAVNTGISGFVDSNGAIHDLVEVNGVSQGPGISGYAVAQLQIDRRQSVYSRYGDWLAVACGLLSLLLYVDYVIVRMLQARQERQQEGQPE